MYDRSPKLRHRPTRFSLGTKDISASTLNVLGTGVTLIDTLGFDDTERSDVDVIQLIADYLQETYAQGVLLTGVILLQPVTGNRVQGSEKKRLRLFKKVCGDDTFSYVVIATTIWTYLADQYEGGLRV